KQVLSNRMDPRAAELLDWAETAIALAHEIRRKGRARGPLLVWGGIGIVATAVAVAAIIGDSQLSATITIQPGELAFSYTDSGNSFTGSSLEANSTSGNNGAVAKGPNYAFTDEFLVGQTRPATAAAAISYCHNSRR